MHEFGIALVVFLSLVGASLGALWLSGKLHARHRHDDIYNVVRLAANIFVVTTSLVLGLLLNSAKNTYEAVDRNVHAFATDIVLLDRSLRHQGAEALETRQRLHAYMRRLIEGTWGPSGPRVLDDPEAERLLDEVGNALAAIRPNDPVRADLWREAENNLQSVVKRRWALIEESEGTIPPALMLMLGAWLVLIFASVGYRAPHNAVVRVTLVVAAALIAASVYLLLDLDQPFAGAIQVSPEPLERAERQVLR
jgi:hypothetical protein